VRGAFLVSLLLLSITPTLSATTETVRENAIFVALSPAWQPVNGPVPIPQTVPATEGFVVVGTPLLYGPLTLVAPDGARHELLVTPTKGIAGPLVFTPGLWTMVNPRELPEGAFLVEAWDAHGANTPGAAVVGAPMRAGQDPVVHAAIGRSSASEGVGCENHGKSRTSQPRALGTTTLSATFVVDAGPTVQHLAILQMNADDGIHTAVVRTMEAGRTTLTLVLPWEAAGLREGALEVIRISERTLASVSCSFTALTAP
jgi:hypothetical protein